MSARVDIPHWSNGLIVRGVFLWIPLVMLVWALGAWVLLPIPVLIVEGFAFVTWRKAVAQPGYVLRNMIGYLAVGDWMFCASAALVLCTTPFVSIAFLAAIMVFWGAIFAVQAWLAKSVNLPKLDRKKPIVPGDLPVAKGTPEMVRKALEYGVPLALCGGGLVTILVLYAQGQTDVLLAVLALFLCGLAAGFSSQLRGLLVARRLEASAPT